MSYPLFFSSIYLAGGLLIFLMGFVILRENPRSAVNRATALMLFSGALGTVLGALGRLLETQGTTLTSATYASSLRSFAYLWEFFFPSLLYFALVYPLRLVSARRLHVLEAALYVPHVCHLALVLFLGEGARYTGFFDAVLARLGNGVMGNFLTTLLELVEVLLAIMNKVHQQLFSLVNLAYAMLAIWLLRRSRMRVANARVRGQLSIVLAGLTLCVAFYTAAKLLPVFFPYRPSGGTEAVLISLALLLSSSAIAWAIIRYKFLDMQNLARRSILYGATAVIFAVVYLLVIKQVTRLGSGVFGANVQVLEAGFIVLSIIVFQPLLTAVEDVVEGLLRRRGDPQLLLQNLARGLAAEVDLKGMRERVSTSLKHGLLVEEAGLLTLEEHSDGLLLDRGDRRLLLESGSPLLHVLRFFETASGPALRHDIERSLPRLGEAARDLVSQWIQDYHLLVPLMLQGKVRGLLGIGPKLTGGRFHTEDMALLGMLAHQISTSLENVRLLSENVQKRILEEEINLASEIQKGLLPKSFPQHPGYRTHAVSFASKFVGGDYFDIFCLHGSRMHLAIADVSGKGVPAAILMSYLRAALRSHVLHLDSPADVLSRINNLLYESTSPEKFATFFYGTLDIDTNELVYANAGHNYPIRMRADRSCHELSEGGLPLGIMPDITYQDGRLVLEPGDTLFLYTDGITEATNGDEEEFGSARLQDVLLRCCGREPRGLVDAVLEEVRAFTHGSDPGDDLTMVVVCRAPDQVAEGAGLDGGR